MIDDSGPILPPGPLITRAAQLGTVRDKQTGTFLSFSCIDPCTEPCRRDHTPNASFAKVKRTTTSD